MHTPTIHISTAGCVILRFQSFYYPPPTGVKLARPREHVSTPAARRCRLPCVFKHKLSYYCCCAIYHLQAEFLVVSPSCHLRGPCSGGQMKRCARAGTIAFSHRPGARALIKIYIQSVYSREPWTIYIKSLHACRPYPSYRKANHFSLSDDFRQVSPTFGCRDFFNNIVHCQF